MKSRVVQLRASPATFQGLMDADRELGQNREPDLILAFLPSDGGAADTLEAMAEVWPASRRVGCETPRQFADAEIATSGCLQCFWWSDADHEVQVEVLRGFHDSPPDATSVEAVCRSLATADSVLLLADGLRFPVRSLVTDLRRHRVSLPGQIVGVLASRLIPAENEDAGARVFLDTHIYPSACLVLAFSGVTMDHALVHDYAPGSPVYTVTRAEENTVHEIDGVPAVDWYRRFFLVDGQMAPMPRTANDFPLMIEGPDPSRRRLCRAMRAFDEPPGAVTYWGDVREGDHVRLGLGKEPSLVRTAARMSAGARAEAALFCAFAGRESILGERAESELADLCGALRDVPLAGCFTFGEIGPGEVGLALHNQTALLALLREKSG
jgi:hypothetical protein